MSTAFQLSALVNSEDDKRLVPTGCRHSFWSEDYERMVSPAVSTRSGGLHRCTRGSKDHKWLVHTGLEHSFGSKDDKRMVPAGSWHLLWSKDDERLLPAVVGPCLGGLRRREGGPPLLGGSKDHKWLVHTGCRRSLWSENDKRLVPTGYRHSLWSEDDERLVPRLLALVRAGSAAAKGCPLPPPREEMITSVYCTTAVSIRLGARMTRGWCPPAVGIRSGARIMSGWCLRLLAMVRADCAAAPAGARITSG